MVKIVFGIFLAKKVSDLNHYFLELSTYPQGTRARASFKKTSFYLVFDH